MVSRPIETAVSDTITSANPNLDINTGGAPCVACKCTNADTSPVIKVYVKESASGDWELWDSFQLPVTTAVASATLRTANTSITLTTDDTIFVLSGGFFAVRFAYQSGTSAALVARTCEIQDGLPIALTATISGVATEAKQDTQITSLQLIDDAVFADDAAFTPGTSKGLAVGMQADETSPDSVDEGDFGVPRMTLDRRQLVETCRGTLRQPQVDSYTQVAINLAAGANQVLVSSAANKQIWVYGLAFTVNVAGTVSFQDEDDTALSGIMQFGITGGMTVSPSGNFAMPLWKLATDKDLEVDVVTAELDGTLTYAIVSV